MKIILILNLSRWSNIFSLGQFQDGGLGLDASAFSRNHRLWRIVEYNSTHNDFVLV